MTRDPQTAHPDDSLSEAAARLAAGHIGCLPVTEAGDLVGIVTTTDVLSAEVRQAFTPSPGPLVGQIMTHGPQTARRDDRLLMAAARMQHQHVRHLPVIDGEGRVVGMLSDRDIRTAAGDPTDAFDERSSRKHVSELRVDDVMSAPPITIGPEDTCAVAARALVQHGVGALAVADGDGKLVGVVSYMDILRIMMA